MALMFPTRLNRKTKSTTPTRTCEKTGGLQVADKMFRINWPCDREICENTEKRSFLTALHLTLRTPAARSWSRHLVAPWTRRWCWSQAAPRESVSAWLSGWPPTPTKHSKVTATSGFHFFPCPACGAVNVLWDAACAEKLLKVIKN